MGKTILTVDDSKSVRQMVTFTLKKEGYDVFEAVDGENALEVLKTKAADMIITDINMPNMNGIELTRQLRENPEYKFVPIIVLTTESQLDKKQEGRKAGATGWIVKPFNPDQLVGVVKKVLG